jgi:hypothetical protein
LLDRIRRHAMPSTCRIKEMAPPAIKKPNAAHTKPLGVTGTEGS